MEVLVVAVLGVLILILKPQVVLETLQSPLHLKAVMEAMDSMMAHLLLVAVVAALVEQVGMPQQVVLLVTEATELHHPFLE
jgi:hypothetical protein